MALGMALPSDEIVRLRMITMAADLRMKCSDRRLTSWLPRCSVLVTREHIEDAGNQAFRTRLTPPTVSEP